MTMNRGFLFLIFCSLLLISVAGICMAEESPAFVAYVQGGESTFNTGADGVSAITVREVAPYFHITDGNKSFLLSVENIQGYSLPLNAALVFTDPENERTFTVEVVNLSLSDGNKSLTLQVQPLEYYEGEVLKSFMSSDTDFKTIDQLSNIILTSMYLELIGNPEENSGDYAAYEACWARCRTHIGWLGVTEETCRYDCSYCAGMGGLPAFPTSCFSCHLKQVCGP